ncbi:MAG: GMC family oxidoreductase [Methylomonas sp.]|jgi:choline dehydrogenase-like flavoprotein|uniref:GMC oxidoreductase n=1 Tax=Methylomonas sp. TaxID=418 RepID=UPI0025EDDBDC|nr:GMC family oxidoreductase [Methylomonas sp.]MCK9605871.1 GMC family oxidoreductase [Methylomonas sp.]
MEEEFDVIIVGSGAGGAPVAHTLVNAGKTVLILEKGPLFLPQYQDDKGLSDFKRDELFATGSEKRITLSGVSNQGSSYYSSHVEPDLNDEPHIYQSADGTDKATLEGYTAQVVGGGTQLYGAVSLRFTETDFRLGSFNRDRTDILNDPNDDIRREAPDWPIGYNDLEPYYTKTEKLIGINGTRANQKKFFSADNYQTPYSPNPISRYVEVGMDALSLPRYRTPLAVITQDHAPSGRKVETDLSEPAKTGLVNRYGDPMGYKSNTWVALLSPIKDKDNFEIRCNCVVTHIENQASRISRVFYRDPCGDQKTVRGKIVVIACSAIESVRLLMLAARENADFAARINPNDLLGRYFLTHCFGGAETEMPDRFDKSVSLDSDWATDAFATEEFIRSKGLWAGGAVYNNTSDQALPISLARTHGSQDIDTIWEAFVADTAKTGSELLAFLDRDFGTRLSVSFMANQVPLRTNRIELHPTVVDKWNRPSAYIIKDWHPHDIYLMDTLAEQCKNILAFGGDNGIGNYPVEGFGAVYMASNARARIANHILGGARFGFSPDDSVLDVNCRAWGFDNLYLTDGSFMPTSGSANPTHTIQANAFRVADKILEVI